MVVTIRGKKQELPGRSFSIPELLNALAVESPDMVTVEVNGEIVFKDAYGTFRITEGDTVEFLYFMGGGRPAGEAL